ncbi:thioredoxin-like protein [Aspergillus cavernicola]|uniref:Thioredoxin-like protein n=1 Tax=Aspergillus cavernicola TaxID=176166 RepID=A0ABR4HHC3_9EURO
MTVIEIEVILDFVCAWCYIGKRKLDRAISLYQKTYPGGRADIFKITWSPYYLNYNPHGRSVPKSDLVDERLGHMTPEQQTALFNRMNQIGRGVGIYFKGGGLMGASTRDAHRLVYLARVEGVEGLVQGALVEGILRAYHEMERDISERNVLVDVAVQAGLARERVLEWLDSDLGGDVVDDQAWRNKDEGKGAGVPRYVVQGGHRLDGVQDESDFIQLLAEIKEKNVE